MVWPEIVLRTAWTDRPGPVDRPRTRSPIRTIAQQPLRHHKQSGHGTTMSVLPCRSLTSTYEGLAVNRAVDDGHPSICDQMRRDIAQNTEEFDPSTDQASGYDIPVEEAATPLVGSTTTPPPVVDAPRRSITPNNRSLAVLESG